MEIIIGKMSGFCPGVKIAIQMAEETLKNGTAYCLGEIVHNEQVIKDLENKGMITVNSLEEVPSQKTVMFRAHGEPEEVYELAKSKNLNLVDLTCEKVKLIHEKVKKEREDSFIIILGKKNHPEVIGTKGFAGDNSYVIETEDDILDAYMEFEKSGLSNVYVTTQTTISNKYCDFLINEIENNFIEAEVLIDKSICPTTEIRQAETEKIAKDVNKMIIIGGKHSSNTIELFKISKKNCEKSYNIETVEELDLTDFKNTDKIGIMAGASTPNKSVEEVKNKLEMISK